MDYSNVYGRAPPYSQRVDPRSMSGRNAQPVEPPQLSGWDKVGNFIKRVSRPVGAVAGAVYGGIKGVPGGYPGIASGAAIGAREGWNWGRTTADVTDDVQQAGNEFNRAFKRGDYGDFSRYPAWDDLIDRSYRYTGGDGYRGYNNYNRNGYGYPRYNYGYGYNPTYYRNNNYQPSSFSSYYNSGYNPYYYNNNY